MAPLVAALLGAGCASTQIGAQWTDPQWPKASLRGTTVLVVCEAQDTSARLLCESQFSARLAALGAMPVTVPATANVEPGRTPTSDATLSAARALGARSVLQTKLTTDYSAVNSGPSFSIGIGGYGGSGGGVGGGVGVAVPVGGASGGAGLGAASTLVDAGGGQVIWSARATAPAASNVGGQIDELATVLVDGVKQTGIF